MLFRGAATTHGCATIGRSGDRSHGVRDQRQGHPARPRSGTDDDARGFGGDGTRDSSRAAAGRGARARARSRSTRRSSATRSSSQTPLDAGALPRPIVVRGRACPGADRPRGRGGRGVRRRRRDDLLASFLTWRSSRIEPDADDPDTWVVRVRTDDGRTGTITATEHATSSSCPPTPRTPRRRGWRGRGDRRDDAAAGGAADSASTTGSRSADAPSRSGAMSRRRRHGEAVPNEVLGSGDASPAVPALHPAQAAADPGPGCAARPAARRRCRSSSTTSAGRRCRRCSGTVRATGSSPPRPTTTAGPSSSSATASRAPGRRPGTTTSGPATAPAPAWPGWPPRTSCRLLMTRPLGVSAVRNPLAGRRGAGPAGRRRRGRQRAAYGAHPRPDRLAAGLRGLRRQLRRDRQGRRDLDLGRRRPRGRR